MAWKENGEILPNQIGRAQLKLGLFGVCKECIYIYRITWKHISLTWTNNAPALSEEYFKQPVERGSGALDLLLLLRGFVALRLRFGHWLHTELMEMPPRRAMECGMRKKGKKEKEGEWGVRCNVYENMLLSRREAHPPGNWMRGVCKIDNFVCVNSVATLPATHPCSPPVPPCLSLVTLCCLNVMRRPTNFTWHDVCVRYVCVFIAHT